MLLNFLSTIKHDFISLSFICFLGIYGCYLLTTQYLVFAYQNKNNSRPFHYRMFRLYNRDLISNAPSKKEKKFYSNANRVTVAFNCMLLATVFLFVVACFI